MQNNNTTTETASGEPALKIVAYTVKALNCPDTATARALAEQRIREIELRIARLKSEKTELNRDKHCLSRWLHKHGCLT
jgi:hypothetical protein